MENFLVFLGGLDPGFIYIGLFCGAYLENIFPPVPGDTIVVFGAYLVGIGTLRLDIAFLSATAGSVLGFMTYYYLGRLIGKKLFETSGFRFISPEQYKKTEQWFEKYGYWIIAGNRFLSGTRSVISIAAGITRLRPVKVGLLALISCAAWNWILIYAGYSLGDNWGIAIRYIKNYNLSVLIVGLAVLFVFIAYRYYAKRKPLDK